jgi:hypothetical protein
LRLLLQRFVKHDLLTDKSDKQLKDVKLEPRSVEMCDFGEKTKELLRKLKKDTNPRVALLQKDMLKFLQSSAQYLRQKLLLTNVVLRNLRCLKPTSRADSMNRRLIQFYQSAHSKYTEELVAGQTEKHDSEAQQAEKSEMQLRVKKKSEALQKQKQAETLITEANDRLTRVATAQNMTEILAAQALLQSGSVQLTEAHKELDELDTLPIAKKLKK